MGDVTGGEWLPCGVCGKMLTGRRSLKQHMQSVHCASSENECRYCHKHYKNKHTLYSHISQYHREQNRQDNSHFNFIRGFQVTPQSNSAISPRYHSSIEDLNSSQVDHGVAQNSDDQVSCWNTVRNIRPTPVRDWSDPPQETPNDINPMDLLQQNVTNDDNNLHQLIAEVKTQLDTSEGREPCDDPASNNEPLANDNSGSLQQLLFGGADTRQQEQVANDDQDQDDDSFLDF